MKIYTKGGDQGHTQIYTDQPIRMSKADPVLECYGTLDELNAHVGMLLCHSGSSSEGALLVRTQRLLFHIGFAISADSKLTQADVAELETHIDSLQGILPVQTSFILPNGCVAACQAHICRTLARRAERALVAVSEQHQVPAVCLQYINRLSDYFFVLARHENALAGVEPEKL